MAPPGKRRESVSSSESERSTRRKRSSRERAPAVTKDQKEKPTVPAVSTGRGAPAKAAGSRSRSSSSSSGSSSSGSSGSSSSGSGSSDSGSDSSSSSSGSESDSERSASPPAKQSKTEGTAAKGASPSVRAGGDKKARERERSADKDRKNDRSGAGPKTGGKAAERSVSPTPEKTSDKPSIPPFTRLYITRLTHNVTKEHVSEIFGKYGPLKEVIMPMNREHPTINRSIAQVEYEDPSHALRAFKYMNGGQLDGQVINIALDDRDWDRENDRKFISTGNPRERGIGPAGAFGFAGAGGRAAARRFSPSAPGANRRSRSRSPLGRHNQRRGSPNGSPRVRR